MSHPFSGEYNEDKQLEGNAMTQREGYTAETWYEAKTGNHQGLICRDGDGENIAVVYNKAHARLIASAPTLLTACQNILNMIDSGILVGDGKHDVRSQLEQAIAKAERGA